jgi:hypothetical protein
MIWVLVTHLSGRQYERNDGTFGATLYNLGHVTVVYANPKLPFNGIDNVHIHYQVVSLTLYIADRPGELGLAQAR